MEKVRAARDNLVEASRHCSRVAHEVEDLAHDILLSALGRGTPLDSDALLLGAPRRHGAFLARCAGRRRARETRYAHERVAVEEPDAASGDVGGTPMSALSPALRTTLLLLLLELEKAELRVALGISDAALRKRFQALRAHSPLARPKLCVPVRTGALNRLRSSQVQLLPQLARAPVAQDRVVALSDPDGHGLIFSQVLTSRPGAATTAATDMTARAPSKGKSCSTLRLRTSRSSSS